jgi:hypothetical protein
MATPTPESSASPPSTTATERSRPSLVRRGAVAVVGSAAANALLLALVLATDLVGPFMALTYPPVVFLSVVGALGATGVYALLVRRVAEPDRTFRRVAVAVLLLSFLPDVGLYLADPAATLGVVLVLMLMHVVVAGVSVAALTGRSAGAGA